MFFLFSRKTILLHILCNSFILILLLLFCRRGGTGKSFLLKVCSKLINEMEGHQFLKIAAPTGSAAYNVDGATLHSLLQIPVKFDDKNCAPPLEGDPLQRLQSTFKGTHLLWIDEKSMVSTTRIYQIDQRLKQARPENADLPFGGISVILMGDYAQLPPVKVIQTFL